jgi:hypothetical protein
MPLTSFPQGVSSFGFPSIGASGPYVGAGQVFWVSSLNGTDASGRGTDPTRPFKTINYALTKCSVPSGSKVGGDFVFVLPGHVETISVAGTAASPVGSISANVAGVTVVGLGAASQRPLIQFSATAGKIFLGAANLRFSNLVFDMATVVSAVVVGITCGVKGVQFDNCNFITSTTANAALIGISLTAGWGDFIFGDNNYVGSDAGLPAAGATSFIAAVAGDRLRIFDSYINGDYSTSLVDGGAIIITNVRVNRCCLVNNNAARLILKGNNSSTGVVENNNIQVNGGAVAGVVSGTGWAWMANLGKSVGSGTASGIAVPGTATF